MEQEEETRIPAEGIPTAPSHTATTPLLRYTSSSSTKHFAHKPKPRLISGRGNASLAQLTEFDEILVDENEWGTCRNSRRPSTESVKQIQTEVDEKRCALDMERAALEAAKLELARLESAKSKLSSYAIELDRVGKDLALSDTTLYRLDEIEDELAKSNIVAELNATWTKQADEIDSLKARIVANEKLKMQAWSQASLMEKQNACLKNQLCAINPDLEACNEELVERVENPNTCEEIDVRLLWSALEQEFGIREDRKTCSHVREVETAIMKQPSSETRKSNTWNETKELIASGSKMCL